MGFKLVRIDSDEPKKIWLSDGTHLIGRGKFLECNDHRVSRKHGSLEVNHDSVSLTSLHHNPCFFKRKGTSQLQILKQNDVTNLTVGDRLGLLPDIYWYEIIQSLNNTPDSLSSVNTQIDDEYNDSTVDEANNTNGDKKEAIPVDTSAIPDIQAESESLLDQLPNDSNENQSISDKANTPSKRSYSSGDESNDVKKIKVEEDVNVDAKPGPSNADKIKVEEDLRVETEEVIKHDVKPEPNNDQGSGDNESQKDNAPQSPTNPRQLLLERCMYGASCYRTNPQHKNQFCHPGDAAWGAGERGVCPWGRGCRRRDPRHWRDHDHPPGTQPPPPPQQGKKIVRRKKKREDDDDTPEQDLIVTGKRQRKTTTIQNWSGSESENELDPFLTDGSDEWEPPTDSSQYTQDTLED